MHAIKDKESQKQKIPIWRERGIIQGKICSPQNIIRKETALKTQRQDEIYWYKWTAQTWEELLSSKKNEQNQQKHDFNVHEILDSLQPTPIYPQILFALLGRVIKQKVKRIFEN